MTKAKGRHRREAGLPEISGAPETVESADHHDVYEETQEETYTIYVSDDDRIVQREVRGKLRQVVDFAFTQQLLIDGEWHDVVRYDCSHGTVHVHRFSRRRRPPMKKELCGLDEIEDAYARAADALFDGWQENRRRYLGDSRKR